jgi:3-hydroxymyristoyl/3-hydroxydecanoyl-(acyl carrier protein) dehydratase
VTLPTTFSLGWGPAQICRVLPHREPMLLVDHVDQLVVGSRPRLRAGLHVSGDEAILRGHFPKWPLWPGAYMLEGLAQAAGLLLALTRVLAAHGVDGLTVLAGDAAPRGLIDALTVEGLLVRAELSFVGLVEPPADLVYLLRLRGGVDGVERVDGRIEAAARTVAEGSLVLATSVRGHDDDR